MPEHDALIHDYSHLQNLPREKEALHALKKIASLVKPIMRARNWQVGTLAEFYPSQSNLLGINLNRGQKICLRLRYPGDQNQFLPIEQVVDTMLHELSHNVFGPHDEKFNALWDQLRKEYESLLSKGYTGEGFLSNGHVLGGRRISRDEARRIARKAAEKRRVLSAGSGQKLGGAPVRAGTDIRTVILDAIERRNTITKGCGSDKKTEKEIIDLTEEATQKGTMTKADEDEANDRAIAQALWDMVQEDQRSEYGKSYIPSTPQNPTGNGGGAVGEEGPIKREDPASSVQSRPPPPAQSRASPAQSRPSQPRLPPTREPPRHVSRLVTENERQKPKKPNSLPKKEPDTKPQTPLDPPSPDSVTGWTCPICTLHNPLEFLSCDACTIERPEEITREIAENAKQKARTWQAAGPKVDTWHCQRCSTIMEAKWWTCSTCGKMKESS